MTRDVDPWKSIGPIASAREILAPHQEYHKFIQIQHFKLFGFPFLRSHPPLDTTKNWGSQAVGLVAGGAWKMQTWIEVGEQLARGAPNELGPKQT